MRTALWGACPKLEQRDDLFRLRPPHIQIVEYCRPGQNAALRERAQNARHDVGAAVGIVSDQREMLELHIGKTRLAIDQVAKIDDVGFKQLVEGIAKLVGPDGRADEEDRVQGLERTGA